MSPKPKQLAQSGASATNGFRWNGTIWAPDALLIGDDAWFGDGSDGNVTIASNTTLTRDMLYNDLTVNALVTLTTDSYRIFVKGTLTVNGIIANNGNPGTINNGVTATVLGGSPHSSNGAGANGTSNTTAAAPGIGGIGGDGGAGVGGAGGIGVANSSPVGQPRALPFLVPMAPTVGSTGKWYGGATGATGGPTAGTHGRGGSGGGVIMILAKTIVNNGSIEANGGVGGTATSGGAGGGGGGGGGVIILVRRSYSGSGSLSVAGGGGGAGHGAGGGSPGFSGGAGSVIHLPA